MLRIVQWRFRLLLLLRSVRLYIGLHFKFSANKYLISVHTPHIYVCILCYCRIMQIFRAVYIRNYHASAPHQPSAKISFIKNAQTLNFHERASPRCHLRCSAKKFKFNIRDVVSRDCGGVSCFFIRLNEIPKSNIESVYFCNYTLSLFTFEAMKIRYFRWILTIYGFFRRHLGKIIILIFDDVVL